MTQQRFDSFPFIGRNATTVQGVQGSGQVLGAAAAAGEGAQHVSVAVGDVREQAAAVLGAVRAVGAR